jgi:hypothetical protein
VVVTWIRAHRVAVVTVLAAAAFIWSTRSVVRECSAYGCVLVNRWTGSVVFREAARQRVAKVSSAQGLVPAKIPSTGYVPERQVAGVDDSAIVSSYLERYRNTKEVQELLRRRDPK